MLNRLDAIVEMPPIQRPASIATLNYNDSASTTQLQYRSWTAYEHLSNADGELGCRQWKITYDKCHSFDHTAGIEVRPRVQIQQLVAMQEFVVNNVMAMAGPPKRHQRHKTVIAHLMLHQRQLKSTAVFVFVWLNAKDVMHFTLTC